MQEARGQGRAPPATFRVYCDALASRSLGEREEVLLNTNAAPDSVVSCLGCGWQDQLPYTECTAHCRQCDKYVWECEGA